MALFSAKYELPEIFPAAPQVEFRGVLNQTHVESAAMSFGMFHTIRFRSVEGLKGLLEYQVGCCQGLSELKQGVKFCFEGVLLCKVEKELEVLVANRWERGVESVTRWPNNRITRVADAVGEVDVDDYSPVVSGT